MLNEVKHLNIRNTMLLFQSLSSFASLRMTKQFFQCFFGFERFESVRAAVAIIGYVTIDINHAKPVRPAAVSFFGGTVHAVQQHGDRQVHLGNTFFGQHCPLLDRLGFADGFAGLVLDLGVSLADIDQEKFRLFAVRRVQLFQRLAVTPKRRSRIAAEDEKDRFFAFEGGESDFLVADFPNGRPIGFLFER
jgi:hypothetical protein